MRPHLSSGCGLCRRCILSCDVAPYKGAKSGLAAPITCGVRKRRKYNARGYKSMSGEACALHPSLFPGIAVSMAVHQIPELVSRVSALMDMRTLISTIAAAKSPFQTKEALGSITRP